MPSCTFSIPFGATFSDTPIIHFGPHPGGIPTLAEQEHNLTMLDERGRKIVKQIYALGGPRMNIFIGRASIEVVHNKLPEETLLKILAILQEATGTKDIRMACSS